MSEARPAELGVPDRRKRLGGLLESAAWVLILAVLVTRPFLGEMSFRTSPIDEALALPRPSPAWAEAVTFERTDVARVSFALLLLAAAVGWWSAQAARGAVIVHRPWLGGLLGAWAVFAGVAVWGASDRRTAQIAWLDTLAILTAGFVALQMTADRRKGPGRVRVLLIVLAATAGVMGAKGIWQEFVEIPADVAYFQEYGGAGAGVSAPPGSPEAKLFEARLRTGAPTGWLLLSNIFASLLLVLVAGAIGLGLGKLAEARRHHREWVETRKSGDVHPPTLGAWAVLAMAAGGAVALVLTRSRAAIGAAAIFTVSGLAVWTFRRPLVRRWRLAVLVAGGVVLLGVAGVVAHGLTHDRLPTKTMTFRWYYWTATAEIIRDHPLGVGPGNFSGWYLHYRRPAAEEAVKAPHNFALHAVAQFGWLGGACYIGLIVGVLVLLCRPRGPDDEAVPRASQASPTRVHVAVTAAAVVASVLVGRGLLSAAGRDAGLFLFEALLPAVLLGALLWAAGWTGGADRARLSPPVRIALACGAGAFVLHNFVTFSFWIPAADLAFRVSAGAATGLPAEPGRSWRRVRWLVVVLAAAGWVAVVVWIAVPIYRRTALTERAVDAVLDGRPGEAADFAARAARADPLDPLAASDAAGVVLARRRGTPTGPDLNDALVWAREAVRRDPAASSHHRFLAKLACFHALPDTFRYSWEPFRGRGREAGERLRTVLNERGESAKLLSDLAGAAYDRGDFEAALEFADRALEHDPRSIILRIHRADAAWRAGRREDARQEWRRAGVAPNGKLDRALDAMADAVQRDPMDARQRITFARMLCLTGRGEDAGEQLDEAERIDREIRAVSRSFGPEMSVGALTADEQAEVEMLRARAEVLAQSVSVGSRTHDGP